MDTRKESTSIHVLMLPWLAHGHISPFLELAKKLTHRNFQIYLCSTPVNINSIKKKVTSKYSCSIQLVELHLPVLPNLPPHYHTTNGLPPHLMNTLKDALVMSSPAFSNILKTLSPDLLIYDYNQPWAASAATSLNIPAVQFLPVSAVFTSYVHHVTKSLDKKYPFPEIYLSEYESLKIQKLAESSVTVNEVKEIDNFFEAMEKSCGMILIKSFREMEGKYIDFLSQSVEKKVVPVGPLVQESFDEDEHGEIIRWLDKKDKSSAIFVSFGSEYFLSKEEREEIALGLELSNVHFIWVLRFPVGENTSIREALPDGFLERIGERGMVVEGWAPQAKILSHSSTGGFVSHCGWSSVMESIKFGIPIIAMPMHIDQPFNARLVNEVGVGLEVARDQKSRMFKGEEIADTIRKVVADENGEKIREKAKELSENIKSKGEEEIDGVVEELAKLCKKRNLN